MPIGYLVTVVVLAPTPLLALAPPFFVAQGASDTYSPEFLEIARRFVEELRGTSSQPVVHAELPGGQHGFDRVASR